jgi:hypothetical protein
MGTVKHLDYVVEPLGRSWAITLSGGDRCGPFASRRVALRAAVKDADRVQRLGFPVRVVVRREDGSMRLIRHAHPPIPAPA